MAFLKGDLLKGQGLPLWLKNSGDRPSVHAPTTPSVQDFEATSRLRRSDFSFQVSEPFVIDSREWGPVSVTLTEVTDLTLPSSANKPSPPQIAPPNSEESFSLLFSGPTTLPLKQGTYRIHNRQIGTFALLVVPMGGGRTQQIYEALFNREVPAGTPLP
jgi:hypothetical protein